MSNQFCFCGTLAPDRRWRQQDGLRDTEKEYPYTILEYERMETGLFDGMNMLFCTRISAHSYPSDFNGLVNHPQFENAIFNGMSMALDVLKTIHQERGEDVDGEQTQFIKRNLKKDEETVLQGSL